MSLYTRCGVVLLICVLLIECKNTHNHRLLHPLHTSAPHTPPPPAHTTPSHMSPMCIALDPFYAVIAHRNVHVIGGLLFFTGCSCVVTMCCTTTVGCPSSSSPHTQPPAMCVRRCYSAPQQQATHHTCHRPHHSITCVNSAPCASPTASQGQHTVWVAGNAFAQDPAGPVLCSHRTMAHAHVT